MIFQRLSEPQRRQNTQKRCSSTATSSVAVICADFVAPGVVGLQDCLGEKSFLCKKQWV